MLLDCDLSGKLNKVTQGSLFNPNDLYFNRYAVEILAKMTFFKIILVSNRNYYCMVRLFIICMFYFIYLL